MNEGDLYELDTTDPDGGRLADYVIGLVTGVLLHLGQVELEPLHDGRNFTRSLQIRNPHTGVRLVLALDIAPTA